MPSLEEFLEWAMIVSLVVAMVLFLMLIAAKVSGGSRIRGDFTLLLWAFLVGWLGAEVFEVLSPDSLRLLAESVHFTVILVFTIFLAWRWRWALRTAVLGVQA